MIVYRKPLVRQVASNLNESHIYQILIHLVKNKNIKTAGKTDIQTLRNKIEEQVGYAYIANVINQQQMEKLVELMLEVALTKALVIKLV